jgi:hypothetical protein
MMSDNNYHVTNVAVFFDDIYHRILSYISKGDTQPKRNMARGWVGEETGIESKRKWGGLWKEWRGE